MFIATVGIEGSFQDWTIRDAQWYAENCGWEFAIDGDRQQITAIQFPVPFGWDSTN